VISITTRLVEIGMMAPLDSGNLDLAEGIEWLHVETCSCDGETVFWAECSNFERWCVRKYKSL